MSTLPCVPETEDTSISDAGAVSTPPSQWLCYILESTDGTRTYVGATDNLMRRLDDHNGLHGASRGAKATRGRQWFPLLYVDGFPSKVACLSFETGVRRIARSRKGLRYTFAQSGLGVRSPRHRRILCVFNLLYRGAPNGKWQREGLCVNWLEADARPAQLILPSGVAECLNLRDMKAAQR